MRTRSWMKYRIQRVSTSSIARFGCLLGWIVTVIPGLVCGLAAWQIVAAARDWLQSWEGFDLSLFGLDYTLDLVDLLQLQDVIATLQAIENRALPLLILLVIIAAVGGGAVIALILVLLGWGYNLLAWLTGGVEVELQELPPPANPAL